MEYKIYNEDCLVQLKNIPNESVDLIVTDCPYHIISGGCTNGAYGKYKEPGGMLNKHEVIERSKKGQVLEGTKHIALYGILNDNDSTTYAKQGKLFKHNDIDFSDWLPELYRALKPNKHIYIYKCKELKRTSTEG